MSFASGVKDDLSRIASARPCCRQAELIAFFRINGRIYEQPEGLALTMRTENTAAARKILTLCRAYPLPAKLATEQKSRLKKNKVYRLEIAPGAQAARFLAEIGLEQTASGWQQLRLKEFWQRFLAEDCCRRAYLRGAFLAGGSINHPDGAYHLEIRCNDSAQAEILQRILAEFAVPVKRMQRKQVAVLYLKEAEQISYLLNLLGSHRSLLEFESRRVDKEMRNHVNRLTNCDNANLDKSVEASLRQIEEIRLIQAEIGFTVLPPALQETVALRLEYPQHSLSELAEAGELGRSALNHRLRRLRQIAENIRVYGKEDWDHRD